MSGEGGGEVGRGKRTPGPAFFDFHVTFRLVFGFGGGCEGRRGRMRESEACEIIM